MRILLVDDDGEGRSYLARFLELHGHTVIECGSGEEALQRYQEGQFELVLSDIRMGGMTGIDLVSAVRELDLEPAADVVLYTGDVDVALAIAALRAGAFDYLTKPINIQELHAVLQRVEEHQALLRENRMLTEHFNERVQEATADVRYQLKHLRELVAEQAGITKFCAYSPASRRVVEQARRYHTDRSLPVLIQGETGVGKEVIANIIHYGDLENAGPFVDINCAALTPTLFESELFGYEAGAFTGATTRGQKGKLDAAKGGTLFLDEIGEIPVELQAKLLRVLEEKSFYRVGGLKKVQTDVRIIAATNVDLEQRVEEGLFRKDLYFRLNVGRIVIPPLRERPEDILPMAMMYLQDFSRSRGRRFARISEGAAHLLLTYNWPGNCRELRNLMEWVSFMFDDEELKPEHLRHIAQESGAAPRAPEPAPDQAQAASPPAGEEEADPASGPERFNLEYHTEQLIRAALQEYGGNKTQAARALGISLRTLYNRLERMENPS